jgi:hypothetical protein
MISRVETARVCGMNGNGGEGGSPLTPVLSPTRAVDSGWQGRGEGVAGCVARRAGAMEMAADLFRSHAPLDASEPRPRNGSGWRVGSEDAWFMCLRTALGLARGRWSSRWRSDPERRQMVSLAPCPVRLGDVRHGERVGVRGRTDSNVERRTTGWLAVGRWMLTVRGFDSISSMWRQSICSDRVERFLSSRAMRTPTSIDEGCTSWTPADKRIVERNGAREGDEPGRGGAEAMMRCKVR